MEKPLGKSYPEIKKQNQTSFNFLQAARTHDPETSHEASEQITSSGDRERHCESILAAMHRLKATQKRPVTGARIANESGMTIVQVMRRLSTDIESSGLISRSPKMFCEITKALRLGWFIKK